MFKRLVKIIASVLGVDLRRIYAWIALWSLEKALSQQGLEKLVRKLREYVPDVSVQYSHSGGEDRQNGSFLEVKIRGQQAFQCSLMLEFFENIAQSKRIFVVDIGDSAGTHMKYLKHLGTGRFDLETISVNLDPVAVEKINQQGMKAILKRAEDITPTDIGGQVDLFTSFEMLEHLHAPAVFLRRLAKKHEGKSLLITVPYLRQSRVGMYHVRGAIRESISAENEHIFELSPEDWSLLFLHSGWKVVYSKTYYQYPTGLLFLSPILAQFWKNTDFEGFWGAILEKDMTFSDCYQDWEE